MVQQILYLNDMKPDVIVHSRSKLTAERFITLVFKKEIHSYFNSLNILNSSYNITIIKSKYFSDFEGRNLLNQFYKCLGYKICIECNKILPLSKEHYYKASKDTSGYQSSCIVCYNKYNKNKQEYYSKNKSKYLDRNKKYRQLNPLNYLKYQKEYFKLKGAFYSSKYRAYKLQRIPKWADKEKLSSIYRNCPLGYHVDHIIPLKGKLVSGLHVPENLQYLLATDNLKKSNKYEI